MKYCSVKDHPDNAKQLTSASRTVSVIKACHDEAEFYPTMKAVVFRQKLSHLVWSTIQVHFNSSSSYIDILTKVHRTAKRRVRWSLFSTVEQRTSQIVRIGWFVRKVRFVGSVRKVHISEIVEHGEHCDQVQTLFGGLRSWQTALFFHEMCFQYFFTWSFI